ncbi:LysE/ArgO family amino acid transporter [Neisseriaceae bacterium ESL0693]|nr:LysE/ArgO family amino acid transporter [Neisseriaceae bacterium ESL0693]
MNLDFNHMFHGILLSGSMIVAIGAQNLFVIKNAISHNHVALVSLICFLCDAGLMSVGIFGVGGAIQQSQLFTLILTGLGCVFLLYYAYSSFKSALHLKTGLAIESVYRQMSVQKTILTTLSITLLNPHVYIDTVLVVGSVGATLAQQAKYSFLLGSLLVSFIWFFALGYGARLAARLFRQRKALMTLDIVTGIIMLLIAFGLMRFAYGVIMA